MHKTQNKGFIQLIIILVLLVVILSLLGISLSSLFSNPVLKENFGFLGQFLSKLWNNYLTAPFNYFWDVIVDLIWDPFVDTMKGFKNGLNPFDNIYNLKNQSKP